MALATEQTQKATPAQLGFLAIYNPSLGTTDETLHNQIVYYSPNDQHRRQREASASQHDLDLARREQNNEQLRQIGLAQGMVEFGRSFSDGHNVDTVDTQKSRIILHELEAGWWILASIHLTVLPTKSKPVVGKGMDPRQQEATEYSSRELKPPILLLSDLLRAHSTFLIHHASSMSALFVRTRRSKFLGILGRYWDMFLSTWNVLMHGNPATSLYGGIKIAACGELGIGVGEEDRGSGEREVLEGFMDRVDGLVDVIVSRFEPPELGSNPNAGKDGVYEIGEPVEPWLGSGQEPKVEDGIVFLGTGALSRKSLCDVSHWVEDLFRWGKHAYGVIDNPAANRRTKKIVPSRSLGDDNNSQTAALKSGQAHDVGIPEQISGLKSPRSQQIGANAAPPPVTDINKSSAGLYSKIGRPPLRRDTFGLADSDGDSPKDSKLLQYLKLGYGTHWSWGGAVANVNSENVQMKQDSEIMGGGFGDLSDGSVSQPTRSSEAPDDSAGHYLIGLLGDIENDQGDHLNCGPDESRSYPAFDDSNDRLLLRTLTVELEREVDARAEADISIDLGTTETEASFKAVSSEHTGTSNTSFESQDRNKSKKVRVVVYVNQPFIFVFLFEIRTDALAFASLYRSLHSQIKPLIKPLIASTRFRVSKPHITAGEPNSPVFDLVWDPKLLTISSTIPNIPDPFQAQPRTLESQHWSRIDALNTHMQIINTYIAGYSTEYDSERTCKTSRGWWIVWTRIPDPECLVASSGQEETREPASEDMANISDSMQATVDESRETSTFGASLKSGPAHPFFGAAADTSTKQLYAKEIILIKRASNKEGFNPANGLVVEDSKTKNNTSWIPMKLVQGIGIDTKRYIEELLKNN